MILIAAVVALLVFLGVREYRRHLHTILLIPHRVHVNGTRGKSSVTRLITGGLQGGGIKTLGKTTGTMPCYLLPSGKQAHIVRIGKPNIIEQLKVALRAVELGVDALVVECMAVLPDNQRLTEEKMIRSTVGVITNVRADHLDEMVCAHIRDTIPRNGTLFTCEQNFFHVLRE